VRDDLVAWLTWLRQEIGFEGLRFDFTKGYGARFAAEYARRAGARFAVGEYWTSMGYDGTTLLPDQDGHRQQLADWVDGTGGTVATFDFTTKGLLQEACRSRQFGWLRAKDGRASGFMGWWPARAVTFLDNHDTGSSQAHWPFPSERVAEGYAYILTHPGMPTVFWDHLFAWGPELGRTIEALAKLRHELGIHRESRLEILAAGHELYAARIDGRLVVKLGTGDFAPGAGWAPRLSGPGFSIWTR
jgi:alpha-amylase